VKRVSKKKKRVPVKAGGAAPTAEELSGILHDLRAIEITHPGLYGQLYRLIGWLLAWPGGFVWQTQENRDWIRHLVARHHLEAGVKWDDAFDKAAADLRDHPATVGPDRIAAAYKRAERKLAPEKRRAPRQRRKDR
jgi:hypothetical protein